LTLQELGSDFNPKDLAEKAGLLLDTLHFSHRADRYSLGEKQVLFLVVAGLKPVGEARSGHWIETGAGRDSAPDGVAEVTATLEKLRLVAHFEVTENHITATVSLHESVLELYESHKDDPTIRGLLLGYPPTAVAAFAARRLMKPHDQDTLLRKAGLSDFAMFRLSDTSPLAELEVLISWKRILGEYSMA
jgi:hypothetical protein